MNGIDAAHSSSLPLTGERTVPGIPQENYWFRRHEVGYRAIASRCSGAVVLEAGCGEGYGADLIAGTASRVIGLDYDRATITHVARRYPRVIPIHGNLAQLPLRTSAVDVVVSLQVIEHLWEQERFLHECARVLRPFEVAPAEMGGGESGQLVLSTPNRLTFSPGSSTPLNPFHTREFAPDELTDLVSKAGFTIDALLGVQHGPPLRRLDEAHGGSIIDAQVTLAVTAEPWPAQLLGDVVAVRCTDFEISDQQLDTSLDLIVIASPG